jgi:hypothetical protein
MYFTRQPVALQKLNENGHASERGLEVLFAVLRFSRLGPGRAEALGAELAPVLRV